ncbi:MAG TPA: S41 family peptidase [Burkholderiaceae bacterium]|nr:S41 family peptidase [Burkholderiaceae bacterium]
MTKRPIPTISPATPTTSPLRSAFIGCVLALLAACGGGGGGSAPTAAPPTAADEVKFVTDYLQDWYLWYRQLPAIDPSAWSTPEQALAALKVPQDRYSYIDTAATFDAFFDEGRALGFGFGYALVGGELWIRYVQPHSNAQAAGLRRGDRIIAIDGTPMATLVASNRVDAALGPATEGFSANFDLLRGTAAQSITMTKSWYTLANVLDARVIDRPGGKVGYLAFLSFTEPSRAEWLSALTQVQEAGAQDIVVDLRDNGGGRLSVANLIASSLMPTGLDNAVGTVLEFNDRHTGSNLTYPLTPVANSGRVRRLVWITSARTCSASESLMTSLRPYMTAAVIGETTCGKPVGFTPPEFNGKVYSIVTFRALNRDGFSDYFGGLAPDCTVGEDYSRPYGDPAEAKLAAALQWLDGAGCPVATTKSVPPRESQAPRGIGGLHDLTGLR